MNGWRYEWVEELPRVVYDILVEWLNTSTDHPAGAEDGD